MEPYGYTFSSRDPKNHVTLDECSSPWGFFNKFTTAAMMNEVSWSLGNESFPDAAYIEDEGRWSDGQLPASFASLDRMREIRNRVSRIMGEIRESQILILTLGLVEAWYDSEADAYLNVTPSRGTIARHPGRFEVRVLDHAENLRQLERLYEIAKGSNADLRLVVTVSPIPMGATFTGQDIAVANAYSKSTLRAVAGDFCAGHDDVDYFPSYEAVTESAPNVTWKEDAIHIHEELVGCVISHFVKNFGSDALAANADPEAALAILRAKLPET